MASTASLQQSPDTMGQSELELLAHDFFALAETQLAKMDPEQRESVVASIHATAESLRAEK
jgi:hypothetical protein